MKAVIKDIVEKQLFRDKEWKPSTTKELSRALEGWIANNGRGRSERLAIAKQK